jgi:Glucose / Sorbosone dehydrogenase
VPARAAALLTAASVALLALAASAGAAMLVKVDDTFPAPVFVTAPPGDPHRVFVVEKYGSIEVLVDGVRKPFLTIPDPIHTDGEAGLLSMAFAPDYAASGLFYVQYTAQHPGDPDGAVVRTAEFRRSATDPDAADPASERVVLDIDHPGNRHHDGGQLQFGPDGQLYISVGDGGVNNDPLGNAQNTGLLLGKLLRIDPRQHGAASYAVPADNPFVGDPAAAPEVYAYGFRNPWRFSFDRVTGDLVIADVGESHREEINFARRGTGAGANYGWRCREGTQPSEDPCSGTFVEPVFDYGHVPGECSAITGGYVVRNRDLQSLYGRYLYADSCTTSGDIRSLRLGLPTATGDASTGLAQHGAYTFGEDSCGHVYVASGSGEVDLLLDDVEVFTPCPEPQEPPPPKPPPPKPPPPKPPPPKDVTPPRLYVKSARSQSLSVHRSLYVSVRCRERCGVVASATIVKPGSARAFRVVVARSVAARTPARLRLLLSPRAARAVRRSLRSGRHVRATLKVVARDAAGNRTSAKKRVRVLL